MMEQWVNVLKQRDTIKERVYHQFLNEHLKELQIDEYQVGVYFFFLEEAGISLEKRATYMSALMLVKTALDLHENVNQQSSTQMTILAGDLYSGYYYQFLSEIDEIRLVRELAFCIKEMNRHKIEILQEYEGKNSCPFEKLKTTETLFLRKMNHYFQQETNHHISSELLYLNRLIQEYSQEFTGASIFQSCYEDGELYYQDFKREILKQLKRLKEMEIEQIGYKLMKKMIIRRCTSLIIGE